MKIVIYCGEDGCGKSTYLINKYSQACCFLGKGVTSYSTYEVIYRTFPELRFVTPKKLYLNLKKTLETKQEIFIDSADRINEKTFDLIINTLLSLTDKTIVLSFDVTKNQLFNISNFRKLTQCFNSLFLDSVTEYVCSDEIINKWLKKNYPEISSSEYNKILNLTNRNFGNINILMWHNKVANNGAAIISQEVICNYLNNYIDDKFKELPNGLLQTLKKSSVIGNIFNKKVLEASNCFNIFGVSKYLKELEDMRIFIKSYIEDPNSYMFISEETHNAIYNSINIGIKEEWLHILRSYYYEILEGLNDEELLTVLHKIKSIESTLNNDNATLKLNLKLFALYSKNNDLLKALSIANELFYHLNETSLSGLKQFIFIYLINIYTYEGMHSQVLQLFDKTSNLEFFDGSFLYLDYYKAKSLYNVGKIDKAFEIIQKLDEKLKSTSAGNTNQPIYSLVYSLSATIENHLNINDGGNHYYALALNHSHNKLNDKSYYYEILSKCDMFFDYQISKQYLEECIDYYSDKKTYCDFKLAEVYFNFGTEILFQEGNVKNIAKTYLLKAESMLKEFPNERFAYGKNNLAIFYALAENDVGKALKTFKDALIVGLSNFTYMTIYLNICACLLLQNKRNSKQFKLAYKKFNENIVALKMREHPTRYEDMYCHILDLLICENSIQTEKLIKTCERLLNSNCLDTFFKNIIQDIYSRNTDHQSLKYSDNMFFYNSINDKKTFFAEFRFWE